MKLTKLAALALTALFSSPTLAQRDFSEVEITSSDLGNGIYMLQGAGGNLAVSIGADGAFLVDDQFAPLAEKIQAKVTELGGTEIKFVFNTHWHGDHTGGNEAMSGAGALIVAHDNVYERMSTDQFMEAFNNEVKAAPEAAWPVVTFTDRVTVHRNGDHIHAIHAAHGHTDGDAMVLFENANVLHMGDLYFNGLYPFIDTGSGGSINGLIDAINKGLMLANADTKIVPGHGPLATRDDMQGYRDMLVEIRDNVAALKTDGKSLEEAVAAKPGAKYDEALGGQFIKPEQLVQFIYSSLP